MTFIELVGTVTEDGKLDVQLPAETPSGKVSVIVIADHDAITDHGFR